jgi:hypothetical protein
MRGLVVAVLLLLWPAGGLAAELGSIAALRGAVTVVRDGEPRAAEVGAALVTGDRVVTGARGMALLQLRGGLTVTVARATEIVVGDVAPSPAQATLAAWLELIGGLVRAVLTAPGGGADVRIETPLAVTSVRSTEWTVEHDDDHTAVFCRDGAVRVAAAGATVTLAPGDGTDVRGDAAPGAPAAWGAPRVADTLARSTLATP